MNHFNIIKFPSWYRSSYAIRRCYICNIEISKEKEKTFYSVRMTRPRLPIARPTTLKTFDTCSKECAEMVILQNI
jgi:hypothetical protein